MKARLRNTTHSQANTFLYDTVVSCISKLYMRVVLQAFPNAWLLLSLFLSGRITLKVIFYHFHNYLFKIYKYPTPHFKKPPGSFVHRYRHAALFLHLKQWCIINEAVSLIQLHYAQIKRNPE
jgi:hypothetical protein